MSITGMSAFGGFLVVAVTILLVYKFRWVPDEHDKQSSLVTTQNNYGTNDKVRYLGPNSYISIQDYCITLTTRNSTQINTSWQCMLKLTRVSTDWHVSHVFMVFYFCVRCSHTLCPLTRTNIEGHHALYLTS